MTFRNTQKYKQTLNIEIQQSPSRELQQEDNENISKLSQHDEDQSKDHQQSQQQQQLQEIGDEQYGSEQQQSQEGSNSLNDQSEQDNDENIYSRHQHYETNQNQYLIPEKYQEKSSIYPKQQLTTYVQHHSFAGNKFQQNQKDTEVQNIINDVLYKRKQKLKQKQLLQNILNSQNKSHNTSSLFRYQPKQNLFPNKHQLLPNKHSLLQKMNQNINSLNQNQTLKDNFELLNKCKQLESKIKLLVKKKGNLQKDRKQKQQKIKEKQHKPSKNKTKQQLSLDKLQKRLQKALQLNLNLSKRVKLQKSKLSSILSLSQCTINSKNFTASIDQESTIKHVQNSSRFNNSVDKNQQHANSHRSGVSDNIFFKVAKSPSIVRESSISRESDGLRSEREGVKSSCQECKREIKNEKYNSDKKKVNKQGKKTQRGYSPTKYKSPILQFNSYLIDSERNASGQRQQKQNIYIEDDMIEQESQNISRQISRESTELQQKRLAIELQRRNQSIELQRREKQGQLKELIGRYQMLQEEQRSMMKRIDQNGTKIKEYENHQYQQVIC